eukprot:Rhum_TRINITY_DN14882_c0_g2::Rhum_TRINITY_DN14882_c0_g2_i2::g.124140::m.124140
MLVTASWGCEDVAVEVGAECQTLAALKALLQDALPALDVEKLCLQIGGRAASDEAVCALEEGAVVTLSATLAAQAAAALIDEGVSVDAKGFCRAAEAGDVRQCKLFLDAGVLAGTPHTRALCADPPLHIACRIGNLELCELLIDAGHDTQLANAASKKPLTIASDKGHTDVCRLLLDRGCNLEATDNFGTTAFHMSCARGHLETSKLLLDRGCAINPKNHYKNTPLHLACTHGWVDLCRLLLDRGCATDEKNSLRETPLRIATTRSFNEICDLLRSRGECKSRRCAVQ